jgi:hypothetical protein
MEVARLAGKIVVRGMKRRGDESGQKGGKWGSVRVGRGHECALLWGRAGWGLGGGTKKHNGFKVCTCCRR